MEGESEIVTDTPPPIVADEDLIKVMDQGIENAEKYESPKTGSDTPPVQPEAFAYEAPKQTAKPRRTMGVEVEPDMKAMFTPDSVGRIFTTGIDAFYRACEAPTLSPEEDQLLRTTFAYYMQMRMPKDAAKYQPEILLIGMLATTLFPRLPQVAPATAPLFTRIWFFLSAPFRRKVEN